MEKLSYIVENADCEIGKLISNWKKILSNYMTTHYVPCNKYEVHNHYFIGVDSVSDDTIDMLNKAKVTIYAIDNIVGYLSIRFKDEKSRDLVFDALKGE